MMSTTMSHSYDDDADDADDMEQSEVPSPPLLPSQHNIGPFDDDDAAHTFRKRRLSLPMHHLNNNTATGTADAAILKLSRVEPKEESHDESSHLEPQVQLPSEPASSSFRKRRLSLTAQLLSSSSSSSSPDAQVPKRHHQDSNDNNTAAEYILVASAQQHSAPTQDEDWNNIHPPTLVRHPSRTVHAGELLRGASSALHQQQQQSPASPSSCWPAAEKEEEESCLNTMVTPPILLPRWKRRHTMDDSSQQHGGGAEHDDKLLLPFDRHIVGMYSCHGMEPIYESDYENNTSEDDDDDDDGPMNQTEYSSLNPQQQPQPQSKMSVVKKINQDRGAVVFPYGNCPRTALFAVYDGHGQGGELVSQFCLHEIQHRLEQHPQFHQSIPSQALIDTFLQVDEQLRHEPLIEPVYSGTTACVALLRQRTLTLANCGDSRAVCARKIHHPTSWSHSSQQPHQPQQWLALDLTQDQNPDVPTELARILALGGYVTRSPGPGLSARVWLDPACTRIGLAMARSLGDHAVAHIGVLAEPVITTHTITPDDDFIILATDGVWEFLSSEQAVQIVGQQLQQHHHDHHDISNGGAHRCGCATKACQALIEAAAQRWHEEEGSYRDDITAIVVRLQELWNFADSSAEEEDKSSCSSSTTTEQAL